MPHSLDRGTAIRARDVAAAFHAARKVFALSGRTGGLVGGVRRPRHDERHRCRGIFTGIRSLRKEPTEPGAIRGPLIQMMTIAQRATAREARSAGRVAAISGASSRYVSSIRAPFGQVCRSLSYVSGSECRSNGRDRPAGIFRTCVREALARARELVPFLREQAPKCEQLRRLTPEVLEALHTRGLFRYMQPKVWGGMELPFVAHYDIPETLARGDISIAWVVVNLAGHHRSMTWWPRKAQEEVWGANPDAGVASGIAYQQGRGVPVEGG